MKKTWVQLKYEFRSDPERLESEFKKAIQPYRFVKRDWWAEYNYVHWLVYAPIEDLIEPPTNFDPQMPVVVIGGKSREAEAREIALRLAQAREAGYSEGFAHAKQSHR